jgi:hypothetical protein
MAGSAHIRFLSMRFWHIPATPFKTCTMDGSFVVIDGFLLSVYATILSSKVVPCLSVRGISSVDSQDGQYARLSPALVVVPGVPDTSASGMPASFVYFLCTTPYSTHSDMPCIDDLRNKHRTFYRSWIFLSLFAQRRELHKQSVCMPPTDPM